MPTNKYGVSDELTCYEIFWRDTYHFLNERGYQLRPRYHPDWVPSWKPGKEVHAEDWHSYSLYLQGRGAVNDAFSLKKQEKVVLKVIESNELPILRILNAPNVRALPNNRTVPILETLHLKDDPDKRLIIVMPFLRWFFDPPFETLHQVLDASRQLLSGLAFIHEHHIAHRLVFLIRFILKQRADVCFTRDACYLNIVMDSSLLIPKGFHLTNPWIAADAKSSYESRSRSSVHPINYYYIDFELSVIVNDDNPLAYGRVGLDPSVPEWATPDEPYDPYKLDIYQLGNVFRKEFTETYIGLEFLLPLVESMTRTLPSERPTASEALATLEALSGTPSRRICFRTYGSGMRTKLKLLDLFDKYKSKLLPVRTP
ncbi:uncharacterized protein EV420DRAFT_1275946 [Desarmillaria tabescens]|uniref:Protein kinase domain-containing protein n=1 Tax=Armillaria tabescens TaxID=1929756 RepID=A0AA39JTZ0_ARMTA|nr:uncharacterized protein EV420DRAFT_1275946 [Desarmillaria tabescens]KAK0447870.1 hypothetical protein EV420DRAFT_1275946 [Desarmillaria tabescens]